MSNRHTTRFGLRLAGGSLCAAIAVLGTFGLASGARADDGSQPVTVTVPSHSMPPSRDAAALECNGGGGGALGDNPTLHPGDQLSCTGTGFAPGEQVNASLGPARDLGTVAAGQDGSARRDLSLPADLGAGRQTLTFTGGTSGRTASFPFTVAIVATIPAGGGGSSGGGGSLARTGLDVLGIAGAGTALVVIGALIRLAGRRRRFAAATGGDRG